MKGTPEIILIKSAAANSRRFFRWMGNFVYIPYQPGYYTLLFFRFVYFTFYFYIFVDASRTLEGIMSTGRLRYFTTGNVKSRWFSLGYAC